MQTLVVETNRLFIQQGIELLSNITDELYIVNNTEFSKSGIGRHFRHIIEHYFSFLDNNGTMIDYDDRPRNERLETDRLYMIQCLGEVKKDLRKFEDDDSRLDDFIEIRSNEGIGQENSPVSRTSYRRELQFLISHTVHHYALIGLILQTLGYKPNASFGVAPSTLKYQLQKNSFPNAL